MVGLLMSRICKLLKLPAVTGYLVAGVIIGCFCLGQVTLPGGYHLGFASKDFADVEALGILSEIELGFIAFSIGSEFKMSDLKKTGKKVAIVGCVQAVVASAVVCGALIGLHYVLLAITGNDILPLPAALILGAIASATAPAAT